MNEQILRFPQLSRIVNLSRCTIWRMEKRGKFPKRIQLGSRAVGWRHSEVQAWLDSRQSPVRVGGAKPVEESQ